jgi:hypothetical protein
VYNIGEALMLFKVFRGDFVSIAPIGGGVPWNASAFGEDFGIGEAKITPLPAFHTRQGAALLPKADIGAKAKRAMRRAGGAIRFGLGKVGHVQSFSFCDAIWCLIFSIDVFAKI